MLSRPSGVGGIPDTNQLRDALWNLILLNDLSIQETLERSVSSTTMQSAPALMARLSSSRLTVPAWESSQRAARREPVLGRKRAMVTVKHVSRIDSPGRLGRVRA